MKRAGGRAQTDNGAHRCRRTRKIIDGPVKKPIAVALAFALMFFGTGGIAYATSAEDAAGSETLAALSVQDSTETEPDAVTEPDPEVAETGDTGTQSAETPKAQTVEPAPSEPSSTQEEPPAETRKKDEGATPEAQADSTEPTAPAQEATAP